MKHVFSMMAMAVLGMSVVGVADADCGPYASNPASTCCYANQPVPVGQSMDQAGVHVRCAGPNQHDRMAHFVRYTHGQTTWKAHFNGADQGYCQIHINAQGLLKGVCHGRDEGRQAFYVEGAVKHHQVRFGIANTGANFRGVINDGKGHGVWSNTADHTSGHWTMRKMS